MLTVGMYLADRYEIVGKVGAGGMSDVYKAMDHILGRNVAIKVLKQEYSEDRNFVTKFRTEAQSAAGLEHPNIVNIYDVGSEEGLHYIVMEYVEGITLKTYIEKKGQLSFKEAVSIAIQVARGIEAAHNKNIIHRDIKPQNIIISTEGKVKVTDFGIARAASANTISSDVMGSVHYASPEQARNGFVDGRSDIYSLGIVMYEMVTGRVPFDGDTTVAVAIQHLQEEMVAPSAYAPNLPISLEKIILKCAQKNPDRRYQTITELLTDLRKALINPDEDFVVIAPLVDNTKTKVISDEEISQIKDGKVITNDFPEETQMPEAGDETEDEYEEDDVEEDSYDDEEEEEGILNPKLDKAVTIAGIVVAVIIVGVIIFLIASIAGGIRFRDKDTQVNTQTESQTDSQTESQDDEEMVAMIDIVGLAQKEAQRQLEAEGFSIFVTGVEESEGESGLVLSQSYNGEPVSKGEMIPYGSTIGVVISGEKAVAIVELDVPYVVGATESNATNTLSSLKLIPNKTYDYSNDIPAGEVISQNPEAGTTVQEGTTVTLVISQGKKSVTVPSVTGKESGTGKTELENAGLTVKVEEAFSDTVKEGTIISQSVAGGKTVSAGTEVTITVSKGSEIVYYSVSFDLNDMDNIPADATKADVSLIGSDGSVILSWNKTDFIPGTPFMISKDGIRGISSGKVKVTWYATDTAEDGTTTDRELSTDTKDIEFTKQQ